MFCAQRCASLPWSHSMKLVETCRVKVRPVMSKSGQTQHACARTISASVGARSATFACPFSSHCWNTSAACCLCCSTTPTAACEHCAAILPLPICRHDGSSDGDLYSEKQSVEAAPMTSRKPSQAAERAIHVWANQPLSHLQRLVHEEHLQDHSHAVMCHKTSAMHRPCTQRRTGWTRCLPVAPSCTPRR